ncbi:MAG: amino acid ABC transporter permease [Eubacteriales bacterium]|nr:amino acid ABC transporter permease [Eubacteriales bacterium]
MSVVTMEGWLATAPAWVTGLPEGLQWLGFQLYMTFIYQDRWTWFVDGLKITFIVTLGALALGLVVGLLVAVLRTAHDSQRVGKRSPILGAVNALCKLYLTVIRGTPMMVQLLIMGFVIMVPKTDRETLICGVVTLGINSGAYVAEIARSGLMSIGAGQMEAGRSLGLNYRQTMWYIIIPQAIKNILPALGNEMITLLKDTSLVSVIALRDVTKQAQNIVSATYQAYVPYISLAVIYLVLVLILTKLLGIFERRLRASDRR